MKILAIVLLLLSVTSCKNAIDGEIQKHQKQQLDFEKADQDFEQSIKSL